MKQNPFAIVKHRHITEKSSVLEGLKTASSNPSVRACNSPKYVFVVDRNANKRQIADAIEEIYREKNIKVVSVNTINMKGKERRVRGRKGMKASFKKAIITLDERDTLDSI